MRLSTLFPMLVLLSVLPCQAAVNRPILKWQYGGCYPSWCERGWYSSPAVADLDEDGTMEVIGSAYSIAVLDGRTGSLEWRVGSGHDRSEPASYEHRTWPGIEVVDVDNDGHLEIITAHSGGFVSVYDRDGYFKPGWPRRPTDNELRGLVVYDLDGDGKAEIIVTGATYGKTNTWVFAHDGTPRSGWPQLADSSGYAYGVFNDNCWVDDLDGDHRAELIVPSDVHYICAYDDGGSQLPAHSMYGGRSWGGVGVWESMVPELRGWGDCSSSREERYRANFAHGASVVSDLDGDGSREIVTVGNMYDCANGHPPGKYNAVFIFNADRSRFAANGWDWSAPPTDTGAPLSEDYNIIENCQPNPVVADLDNDGTREILHPSYDGRMHAFWLDKTEHHNWPYAVYNSGEGVYRFASEPVVADLDRDGCAEVIFTSWPQKSSSTLLLGKVHILDCRGTPLHEIDLPAPKSGSQTWNGGLAAPTIANIDDDADLELVINTTASGFVAYDLPGTARATVLWRSGRNRGLRSTGTSGHSTTPQQPGRFSLPPLLHPLLGTP